MRLWLARGDPIGLPLAESSTHHRIMKIGCHSEWSEAEWSEKSPDGRAAEILHLRLRKTGGKLGRAQCGINLFSE